MRYFYKNKNGKNSSLVPPTKTKYSKIFSEQKEMIPGRHLRAQKGPKNNRKGTRLSQSKW